MSLTFYHPALDEGLGPDFFAWGTVPRGSSDDMMFRLRNVSSTYDAVDVTVAIDESGTPGSPAAGSQHYLSLDGLVFAATVSLDNLAADTVSPLIWLRRVTPSTATAGGPYGFKLRATAVSWVA